MAKFEDIAVAHASRASVRLKPKKQTQALTSVEPMTFEIPVEVLNQLSYQAKSKLVTL